MQNETVFYCKIIFIYNSIWKVYLVQKYVCLCIKHSFEKMDLSKTKYDNKSVLILLSNLIKRNCYLYHLYIMWNKYICKYQYEANEITAIHKWPLIFNEQNISYNIYISDSNLSLETKHWNHFHSLCLIRKLKKIFSCFNSFFKVLRFFIFGHQKYHVPTLLEKGKIETAQT